MSLIFVMNLWTNAIGLGNSKVMLLLMLASHSLHQNAAIQCDSTYVKVWLLILLSNNSAIFLLLGAEHALIH